MTINQLQDFQNTIFSSIIDTHLLSTKVQNGISPKVINNQLILSFSLNYERISILSPFLSEPKIEKNEFIHYDQELLLHLLKNNISFPISIILDQHLTGKKHTNDQKLVLEPSLYEELKKHTTLELLKEKFNEKYHQDCKKEEEEEEEKKELTIEIREKTKLEEIIEKDDIDGFRLISNSSDFDFNGTIKKVNQLYQYTEIPIILYCIEKNAIKCFKYALINGADPSHMSIKTYRDKWGDTSDRKIWDGYGFAGAIGNIQIIKMIKDQGIPINGNVIKGSSKFHQNHIIQWIEKENSSLLEEGIKECIKYCNYEGFDIIARNFDINSLMDRKNSTLLHIATTFKAKEIGELLISKRADINAKDIIYQIIG